MRLIKLISPHILFGFILTLVFTGAMQARSTSLIQEATKDTLEVDTVKTGADTVETRIDTVKAPSDTIRARRPGRLESDTLRPDTLTNPKPAPEIQPWRFKPIGGMEREATDSTLRWQIWTGWMERANRRSGAITYRRGRMGYNESLLLHAHESRHQELAWEGHALNDPVTGMVRWTELPHHKINTFYQDQEGGTYRSNFNLNQFYVNKPESRFIYDEGRFNYRNLEFMVTKNFSRKTNAEISYWLRRDGGEYPRANSTGNQIFARVYHHLDNDRFLKAAFLHNGFDLEQSFGYRIQNMNQFNFNQFTTQAREREATSSWSTNNLNLGYYRRNAAGVDRYRIKLFMRSVGRDLSFSGDTSQYNVRSVSTKLQAWEKTAWADFYAETELSQIWEGGGPSSSLAIRQWSEISSRGVVKLSPLNNLDISLEPMIGWRSDNYQEWELGGEVKWDIGDLLQLQIDGAQSQFLPAPQQLYWDSELYSGNPDLVEEQVTTVGGEVLLHPSFYKVGVRGRIKYIEDGIFMNLSGDSTFTNVPRYRSKMAEAFIGINHPNFEWEATATWHRYRSDFTSPLLDNLTAGPERIWFKSKAYIKGYVFDRAAFVKAGVFGILSPNAYRTSQYITPLGSWQSANSTAFIPPFYRVDLDLSARVRKIMVHLRWENVTNRLGQLGYFETANYPMPGRRFIFGIRVIFNN